MLDGVMNNPVVDTRKAATSFDDHLVSQNAPVRQVPIKIETNPNPLYKDVRQKEIPVGRINNIELHIARDLEVSMVLQPPRQRGWKGQMMFHVINKEEAPPAYKGHTVVSGDNHKVEPYYKGDGVSFLDVRHDDPSILTGYSLTTNGSNENKLHFYASTNPDFFQDRELNAPGSQPIEQQDSHAPVSTQDLKAFEDLFKNIKWVGDETDSS
jgi:hypothetical protein